MRILFLTPWYPDDHNPNHGIFIRDQAVAVRKYHEVEVISSKIDYSSFAFFSYQVTHHNFKGVNEHRIRIKKSLPIFNQLVFFAVTIYQTIKIARKFEPDIIHGNIGYPGAFWSWSVSRILKRPYVITEHTSILNNFRSPIHKLLTIAFLKKADAILSVSNHSANEVYSYTGKKPFVIPNMIDFEKFFEVSHTSNEVCQIGFLGGLNTNTKGLDILLEAVAGIHQEYVLHIGGSGKLLDQYKRMAQQLGIARKCVFHGFVSHYQVPLFMKQLHFFVSASRFESFGMVMVEAMACGLPVVATDSGGPADFITALNGILVPKEDPYALRMAVEKMMVQHASYNPMQIRAFAVHRFSAERFYEQMKPVYTKLQ